MDAELVRAQLAEILASAAFARTKRQSAFLSYLVDMMLEGRAGEISEYSIAEIYGRPAAFDPSSDPTVRVEARRLRARLEAYYAAEGANAPVIITLPHGSYIPEWHLRPTAPEPVPEAPPAAAATKPPEQIHMAPMPPMTSGAPFTRMAAALGLALSFTGLAFWRLHAPPTLESGIRETVQLTAFPGVQQQPALSPDRRQLAFSWDGDNGDNFDIYVKPTWGQDIVRLTTDPARDQSPAWSPDGRSIAFLRELPDLRQAVYVVPANGGAERQVTIITTGVAGIAWTPDGKYLVVPDSPPKVLLGLFRVSVLTGERRQLTAYRGDFHPAFSPDGRTLAFVRMDNGRPASTVCLQRLTKDFLADGEPESLDSTGEVPKPNQGEAVYPSREIVDWPHWSTDGQTILFTRITNKGPVAARVHLRDRQVEVLDELGTNTYGISEYSTKQYIYSRYRRRRFLAWTRPGAKVQTLASGASADDEAPDLSSAPSPRSPQLAFVSARTGAPALYISGVDGRDPRRIDLPGVTPSSPRWSPDARRIVFAGWRNGRSNLYIADLSVNKGTPALIPTGEGTAENANFSRDGKWIYYSRYQNGFTRVWRIAASGGSPEMMTQDQGSYSEESPDGRKLYYGSRETIRELDLRTRHTKTLIEGVCGWIFRSNASGIYALERGSYGECSEIRFHPFSGNAAGSLVFSVGTISGFSLSPREGELLTGFDRQESDIESAAFR